jgi:diguanylate cyclase (GGDEF)-like protein
MGSDAQARIAQLEQENEALRAALADAERRLHARQGDAGDEAAFRQALDRAVGQANRHGTPSALAIMCLEGLEDIRRSGGADAADRAVSHAAAILTELVRANDVVARTGADRFGLVLDHLDADSAIDAAERLARCIVERPLALDGGAVPMRVSTGVATILKGDDPAEILARAERSLARAREA